MKLPKEVKEKVSHLQSVNFELIIRDCAAVCLVLAKKYDDSIDPVESYTAEECAVAILARYGLEEKE